MRIYRSVVLPDIVRFCPVLAPLATRTFLAPRNDVMWLLVPSDEPRVLQRYSIQIHGVLSRSVKG